MKDETHTDKEKQACVIIFCLDGLRGVVLCLNFKVNKGRMPNERTISF